MRGDRTAVSGVVLIYLALSVLILPIQWVGAVILSAVIHEACHYFAVHLCGGKVQKLGVGILGARMEVFGLQPWQELLCALAGPAGGLVLLSVARWLPRTALCAAFQSLFNLLPVYPLDGGRALRCTAELLGIGEKPCRYMEKACLSGFLILGLHGTFVLKLGLIPVMLSALLLYRIRGGKIACKAGVS